MKHRDCGGELLRQKTTRTRPGGRYKCAICGSVLKLGTTPSRRGYIRAQGFVTATGRK